MRVCVCVIRKGGGIKTRPTLQSSSIYTPVTPDSLIFLIELRLNDLEPVTRQFDLIIVVVNNHARFNQSKSISSNTNQRDRIDSF